MIRKSLTVSKRYVISQLHTPVEPGTILGPNDTKEYLVVLGDGVSVTYATTDEIVAVAAVPEPRSVAEVRLRNKGLGL